MSVVEGIPGFTQLDKLNLLEDLRIKGVPVTTGASPSRANLVLVKVKADFPVPSGGIITLANNVDYEINGFIDLTGDRLVLNGSNTVFGLNPRLDILTTNNALALISGVDSGVILDNVTFNNAGGPLFDMEDTAGNEGVHSFFITDSVMDGATGIGNFENLLIVDFQRNAAQNLTNGATFSGSSNVALRITGNLLGNTVTGTIVDLGTSVFDAISIDHNFIQSSAGLVFLDGVTNSGNIAASGQGSIVSNITFGGNIPTVNNITSGDLRWSFQGNNNAPDSIALGSLSMSGNAVATATTTTGQDVKVAGTTIEGNVERFTMIANNRLDYDGGKVIKPSLFYTVSAVKAGGAAATYSFTIYKNGSAISGSTMPIELKNTAVSLAVSIDELMVNGDFIELFVSNDDGTDTVTITDMQCIIRG